MTVTDIQKKNKEHKYMFFFTDDFCKNKSEYFDYHPLGCPYYVQCSGGTPYTNTCNKDDCIDPTTKQCI